MEPAYQECAFVDVIRRGCHPTARRQGSRERISLEIGRTKAGRIPLLRNEKREDLSESWKTETLPGERRVYVKTYEKESYESLRERRLRSERSEQDSSQFEQRC